MKQICSLSGAEFTITEKELSFYRSFDLPVPDICPNERRRQRLAFRNEGSIYHRKCDGTQQQIISMYKPDTDYKVYDNDFWWSDKWDALDYGQAYDSNTIFFEQFNKLLKRVPKMARIQQGENENSKYTNCASNNKNCYLIFSSNSNEDCLYSRALNHSVSCLDCFAVTDSELCYSCAHCLRCYNLQYSDNCQGCSDSYYLKNCIGCKNCFGSYNLINKEYYFFNKKLTKEEYNSEIKKLNLESYAFRNKIELFLDKHLSEVFVPQIYGYQNENVSGNYIYNSKDVYESFYIKECQDILYCDNVLNIKDSMDISFYGASGENQNLYQGEGLGHGVQNVFCSKLIWGGSNNVYYSYECFGCSDIFACSGLKKQKFCIFNKQYSEREYHILKNQIIENMKKTKEWGRFFPISISPFAYNETVANEFFPLDSESVSRYGSSWKENNFDNIKSDFPDKLSENYINKILYCEVTGQGFRVNEQEYNFLKKNGLPVPRRSPDSRYLKITSRNSLRQLKKSDCIKCSRKIETYNHGKVLCLSCYQEQL